MNLKKYLPAVISIVLLIAAIAVKAAVPLADHQKVEPTAKISRTEIKTPDEVRGVWVTYMTLDVENESDKQAAFDRKIDDIIKDVKEGGFNTLIVQVRPFCDAIYPSKYFPWSHIISGEQGVDPGFDPLEMIVEKCRANDLYIHAWVNPYRVSTGKTPSVLCDDHPCLNDESLLSEIGDGLYLNPASEKAQQLIADGVRELVENYDIDGVQFDDYFYPEDCGNFDLDDYETYQEQNRKSIRIEEFRKQNVSNMVKAAYQAAHEANENILFGISPQGNLRNNEKLYADVKTWCAEKGYIDYICPQIYFSLDNPALTFEKSLSEWTDLPMHDGLDLYVGLSGYKAGTDADDGTWLDNNDILQTEIKILRDAEADGFMLYSYDSFHDEDNQPEVQNVIRYLTTSATQNSSEASQMTTS